MSTACLSVAGMTGSPLPERLADVEPGVLVSARLTQEGIYHGASYYCYRDYNDQVLFLICWNGRSCFCTEPKYGGPADLQILEVHGELHQGIEEVKRLVAELAPA